MATRIAWILVLTNFLLAAETFGDTPSEEGRRLSFGRRQLDQLLDDRPDMKGSLNEDHPVFTWVVEGFDGKRFGERVYWLEKPPRDGYPSEFSPPYMDIPPFLRLARGKELSAIDKWTSLIFELHNLEENAQFEALSDQAANGEITGDNYATGCVRVEFEASKKTKKFLQAHPLPVNTDGSNKFYERALDLPETFKEYREKCSTENEPFGNYDFFLDYYNRVLAPVAKRQGATGEH